MSEKAEKATRTLRHVADELKDLSSCFYRTGNTIVSENIWILASLLYEADELLREEQMETANRDLVQAEQGTRNLLEMVSAMEKIHQRRKEGDKG